MIDKQVKPKLIGIQTRRSFLQRSAALGSLALATPMIMRKASADEKVLNWLTYSGHSADEVIGSRLIPLTQVRLYVVGVVHRIGLRFCGDCLA